MSWAAHVKKQSLDGAAQNPADTCCPSDNKWYLPAPQLRCEFISYSNYVEAPKKCNYVDKPVGPNVSIALWGSIFFMLAYGHRPSGSRLSASPHTVLSRFLSFIQHVHNARGRRTTHSERTKAARRRTMARPRTERTGAVEDALVQSQAEGSTRVTTCKSSIQMVQKAQGLIVYQIFRQNPDWTW